LVVPENLRLSLAVVSGSVFIGLGICIGNVVTPGYVKNNFPKQIGLMTGIFAVSMNLTAALASGFSVRIGEWTGFGWRGSLGIWLVIAALGFVVLILEMLFNKRILNSLKQLWELLILICLNLPKPGISVFLWGYSLCFIIVW
jgi:cyanate permease